MRYETWLPGFHSIEPFENDQDMDWTLFNEPGRVRDDWLQWVLENVFHHTDYTTYHNELAETIFEAIKCVVLGEVPVVKSMKFQKLSGKHSDAIFIEADVDLDALVRLCRGNPDFNAYIENNYTSCSGFHSYHSNDPDTWLDGVEEKPEHKIGAMLDCLVDIDSMDLYEACNEVYVINHIDIDALMKQFNTEFDTEFKTLQDVENGRVVPAAEVLTRKLFV